MAALRHVVQRSAQVGETKLGGPASETKGRESRCQLAMKKADQTAEPSALCATAARREVTTTGPKHGVPPARAPWWSGGATAATEYCLRAFGFLGRSSPLSASGGKKRASHSDGPKAVIFGHRGIISLCRVDSFWALCTCSLGWGYHFCHCVRQRPEPSERGCLATSCEVVHHPR